MLHSAASNNVHEYVIVKRTMPMVTDDDKLLYLSIRKDTGWPTDLRLKLKDLF